jgi:hypothetical protein
MVFLDTQELGTTPLTGIRLPVGTLTLRLVGPDRNVHMLQVQIEKDAATRMDVLLETLPRE